MWCDFMNSNKYDVAVIGGGASGLLCAVLIKMKNSLLNVAVIESQDRVGKKLLTTGNGRCNLTNMYAQTSMYHGSFKQGAEHLLEVCPPLAVVDTFEELGLLTYSEDDGRVYPVSKQANSVLDILRQAVSRLEIDVMCNQKINDIKAENNYFILTASDIVFKSDKIVIATGSRATPSTGASDSIFAVLKKLGHNIVTPVPALCPVTVNSEYLKSLKGIRVSGKVRLIKDNKTLREEYGEIQFTENALSGICVFNLARIANTVNDTELAVSLLPERKFTEIYTLLKNKIALMGQNAKAEDLLVGYFNKMIGLALIKSAGISPSASVTAITETQIKKLVSTINDWRFKVVKHSDFSRSQVTAGGVDGSEINEKTMESTIIKNMYLIGEAIDCDGDCGGMNLQFAFSSAFCAACDISL